MSFQRKLNKLKRDPKAFFEDSITKQYSRAYEIISTVKKSNEDTINKKSSLNVKSSSNTSPKVIVNKALTIVENAQLNVKAKNKPKTKLFKDYFEEITVFTQQFDVNSLELNDKKIWPYLRNNLWIHMNFVAIGKNNWKNVSSVHIYNSKNTQVNDEFRDVAIAQYNAKELVDLDNVKADIIFLVNMNSSEQVVLENGKIYHRVTDPFYEVAKKVANTIKLEFVKSGSSSISLTQDYTHPTTIVLPPKIERVGYSSDFKIHPALSNTMKQFIPSLNPMTESLLKENMDYELHLKEYYKEVLGKINPKIIFLYAFHYNAPLISAADELGILTVDIQHGLQVGWNPLYTNYDEMPLEGYPEIPDYFAVWGEKEFNNIRYSIPSEKHQPIYMGAPWLEKIKKIPSSISEGVLSVLSDDKYEHKILIVMQNQKTIPKIYRDIIDATKNENILWVIRHHPKCEPFSSSDFSTVNKNVLLDAEIDSVLFSELFKYINITISEGSALAVEASYFGIINIVTSKMGVENYQKEVDDGIFYYLESAHQFNKIIEDIQFKEDKTDSEKLFKKVNTETFIHDLLLASKSKKSRHSNIKKKNKRDVIAAKISVESEIVAGLEKASYLANSFKLDKAIEIFKNTRQLLTSLPSAKLEYDKEQMLWIKDARVFQRKVRETFGISRGREDVILIGDSLALPRPLEVKNINFGMTRSYAYMFNNNSHGLKLMPWAQRYLTTTQLLNKWDDLVEITLNKHLVIHLGINDSAERIFSEEQRTAMASLSPDIKKRMLEFAKVYRKEIILSQDNFSYVPYEIFVSNVDKIVMRALEGGVKSVTFISIIPFPESHEFTSPGAINNCKRYNLVLEQAAEKFEKVKFLDITEVLTSVKKNAGILSDNVHLSIPGHRALATAIFSKLSIERDNDKVYRAALIGVGNLGSRHLQGLARSNNKLAIECFEPNQANIDQAFERFKEVGANENITLKFVSDLQSLSENIDIAIIATNSDIRAKVVVELLNTKNIRNLILEKVLFQDSLSYTEIDSLIEEKGVNVWVNHPRRMFDIHKPFLSEIREAKKLSFQVSGVNWGLGSNGLHFLDFLTWITDTEEQDIELEWNRIGRTVEKSKRPQFKEVFGTISGSINNSMSFSLTSLQPVNSEVQLPTITIVSDSIKLFIDEYNGVVNYAYAVDNWKWHILEGEFPLLFQSEMTSTVVDSILEEGKCALPSYKTAMWLHLPFINTIKLGIEDLESEKLTYCPIS